jgi:cyclophilin family peptidyl-prolyl cis-trans isomerase/HEAT repeat protein
MLILLAGLALATTAQEVHEAEWQRVPISLDAAAATTVRVDMAHALGRLRRAEALPKLQVLASDPALEVRIAAAEALGYTPGTAGVIRTWLQQTPVEVGWAGRAREARGLRVTLVEALGRQGDGDDVGLLVRVLQDEPWPYGAAAARALGRLGRRGVEASKTAIPALVANLSRVDPRFVSDVAYALGRIGMADTAAEHARAVAHVAQGHASGPVRAWLLKAAWPALSPQERTDLFLATVTDAQRAVQAASLDMADGETLDAEVLAAFLLDDDPWVRSTTVEALGRATDVSSLSRLASSEDPWVAAAAQGALMTPSDDPRPRVAAAGLSGATDVAFLLALALDDPSALVRSSAAGRLEAMAEDGRGDLGGQLLAASDPVVREVAMQLLASSANNAVVVKAVLAHLMDEEDLELTAEALRILSSVREEDVRAFDVSDPGLQGALTRVLASPTARVRHSALTFADTAAWPSTVPEVATERELWMPDGTVRALSAKAPSLVEVHRVRGARVHTTQGVFTLRLDPETAPLAVNNFALLAEQGFFDGLYWHRVVPGFVVQTGCPRGDGWGGPGWTLPDEVSAVPYDEGSVGMARNTPHDTGGSQWFVTTGPTPHLVGDYTRFGDVSQGMEVVRRLERGDQILTVRIERVSEAFSAAGP